MTGRTRTAAASLVLLWTLGVTLARGLRWPNDFAEAHWLLDYRFGFLKRGLAGTLLSLVTSAAGVGTTPEVIRAAAVLMMAAWLAMLVLVARDLLRRHAASDGVLLALLVFSSSPFVVMSGHLTGYFDALLWTAAAFSAALVFSGRLRIAGVVQALAMLVHESNVLVGYPWLVVAGLHPGAPRDRRGLRVAVALPLLAFAAVALHQALLVDAAELRRQLTVHLDGYGFVASRAGFVVELQTIGVRELLRAHAPELPARLLRPWVLAVAAPGLAALLYFCHAAPRLRPFAPRSLLVLGACLAPLAIHVVAWDSARISLYPTGGALLAIWILSRPPLPREATPYFPLLAVPAVLLHALLPVPLMDGEVDRLSGLSALALYAPALVLAAVLAASGARADAEEPEVPR